MKNEIETFLISPQYYGGDSHVSFSIKQFPLLAKLAKRSNLFFTFFFTYYFSCMVPQYYSPDELNRRYSAGIKRMMSRSTRANVMLHLFLKKSHFNSSFCCSSNIYYIFHTIIRFNYFLVNDLFCRENYLLIIDRILGKILCKVQWNSICKS